MVRTAEDAGYDDVIWRDDSTAVQRQHDPTLAHDGAGE
jgi:hypothetical protein